MRSLCLLLSNYFCFNPLLSTVCPFRNSRQRFVQYFSDLRSTTDNARFLVFLPASSQVNLHERSSNVFFAIKNFLNLKLCVSARHDLSTFGVLVFGFQFFNLPFLPLQLWPCCCYKYVHWVRLGFCMCPLDLHSPLLGTRIAKKQPLVFHGIDKVVACQPRNCRCLKDCAATPPLSAFAYLLIGHVFCPKNLISLILCSR